MRVKLIVLISLIAAIVAAGLSYIFARILDGYWGRLITSELASQRSVGIVLILAPIIVVNFLASFFVYRHTARKRKTQAFMTATAGLVLSIVTLFVLGWMLPSPSLRY
jgi:hypothetical protein